jgi:ABC-type branched-subunit amino acid transport system ATPase component
VSFLFSVCDQITLLNFGEVVLSGPAAQVHGSELLREAYLGPALPQHPEAQ